MTPHQTLAAIVGFVVLCGWLTVSNVRSNRNRRQATEVRHADLLFALYVTAESRIFHDREGEGILVRPYRKDNP